METYISRTAYTAQSGLHCKGELHYMLGFTTTQQIKVDRLRVRDAKSLGFLYAADPQ